MARYTFFNESDPSVLSAERQKQIQDFANHFVPLANSYGYVDSDVVSIVCNLQPDHYFLLGELKKAPFYSLDDPSADLLPLLLDEGVDLGIDMEHYYPFGMDDWRNEVAKGGLHLSHFRMPLADHKDRLEAAVELSDSGAVSDVNASVESFTITELSAFRFDDSDISLFGDERSDVEGYTIGQVIKAFWQEDTEEKWSMVSFSKILKKMVELRVTNPLPENAKDWSQHLSMICREHLPIAYNMGYRMAAAGVDMAIVVGQVQNLIAKCTSTIKTRPVLQKAIRRQALVNFCSAFPEALKFIDADPSELYGCQKDGGDFKADLDHTSEVFGGPLQAFTFGLVDVKDDCRALIARSLKEQGLGFKLEYLAQARSSILLLKMPEIFEGLEHPSPVIQEKGLDWLYELDGFLQSVASMKDWLKRVFTPQSVPHYTDVELLSVIESAIVHDTPGDLKAIFEVRPQLTAPTIEMLVQHDKVNPHFFDAFGFDRKEMIVAGSKATSELIDRQMGTDLGL